MRKQQEMDDRGNRETLRGQKEWRAVDEDE